MSGSNDSSTNIIEYSPLSVQDFSSQYGSNNSRSYAVGNICKRPEIYPLYGDSTQALVFRTYGPWWINLPSYQCVNGNYKRWEQQFTSRDFVDIRYLERVNECTSLNIYEIYNPGTLEVVYVGEEKDNQVIKWHRVWTFPQPFSIVLKNNQEIFIENGRQQLYDLFGVHVETATLALQSLNLNTDHQQMSKIHTLHTYPPAARLPRIVKIPLTNKVPFPTRHVRLEFDHSTANYYIEIDTIILCGRNQQLQPSQIINKPIQTIDQQSPIHNLLSSNTFDRCTSISEDNQHGLLKLPFEVLLQISSYLDLHSLMQLSSTCRGLYEVCLHPLQYLSVNLQPYWNSVTNEAIENFFVKQCTQTRYLSLSWTKSISIVSFNDLLQTCATNLLQLNLASCRYLKGPHIQAIADNCPNLEILGLENCCQVDSDDFKPLANLRHIRSLNVYRTRIDYKTLLPLIDNNKAHLQHINLGSCQSLIDPVGIVKMIFARCSQLRSIDLWRLSSLKQNNYLSFIGLPYDHEEEELRYSSLETDDQEELTRIYSLVDMPVEISSIGHMTCLCEIDIGWTDPPPGFVQVLVQQVGRALIKIFLTACRRISNYDITAISENCPKLRQLDILGSNIIGEEAIEQVLKRCVDIEFLDLSFCSKISNEAIARWKSQYKSSFKRSYQPINNDDVCAEFP